MNMPGNKVDTTPDEQDSDHEAVLDQVAREMMDAIGKKDKSQLLECFHVLVADMIDKMSSDKQE